MTQANYRLVAADLDDTLLTDDLTVTEYTKQTMASAIAQGVHLTIATGRMFASAQRIARQVGLNVPIITYQGSLIRNLLDGATLYERSVPVGEARKLYEYARENDLHLQTCIDDRLYSFDDGDKIAAYASQSGIPYVVQTDFDLLPEGRHTKMIIIDDPAKLDDLLPILRSRLSDEVHLTKSKANYLEFVHREGTKGHALRFLAAHYGIPMEETIAIGDAWNDREMIEAAGLGVSMANGVPALREMADYVTLGNNEDGVAHVLEKFVLGRRV